MFVYTAFAIDAYAGRIVGWTCSASKQDRFVRRAIRMPRNSDTMKVTRCWTTLFIIQMRAHSIRPCGSGKPFRCPG